MCQTMASYKNRNIRAILYEDNLNHIAVLDFLSSTSYSYAYILHDKDTWTKKDEESNPEHIEGSFKKPHFHLVLKFPNARYPSAVAEELGIPEQEHHLFTVCPDLDNELRYFVHADNPDKYQYDASSVVGNLAFQFNKVIDNRNEGERVLCILDLLDSLPRPTSYRAFLVACCKNNLYGEFRRLGIGATKLLDEHNMSIFN